MRICELMSEVEDTEEEETFVKDECYKARMRERPKEKSAKVWDARNAIEVKSAKE